MGEIAELSLKERYTTSDGEAITVTSGTAKQSFIHRPRPDEPRVHGRESSAYVFAEVDSEFEEKPSRTSRSNFYLVVDGTVFPTEYDFESVPHFQISSVYKDVPPPFEPADEDMRMAQRNRGGIGGIVTDIDRVTSVGLGYSEDRQGIDAVWDLGSNVADRLTASPDFIVRNLHVEGPVAFGREFTTEITVRNAGESSGVFRAVLGESSTNHPRGIEQASLGAVQRESRCRCAILECQVSYNGGHSRFPMNSPSN